MQAPDAGRAASPPLRLLLSVRSEDCAQEAAAAEIQHHFQSPAEELAPRLLLFRAPEALLAVALGLELFGSLALVMAEAHAESHEALPAALASACRASDGHAWPVSAVAQYRALRGREALSAAPSFKIFFRSLSDAALEPRALQTSLQAALTARGWRPQMSDPELSLVLLVRSAGAVLVTAELRAHGPVPSARVRPDLSAALSEEFVKSRRAELRRLQRSRKKRADSQLLHAPTDLPAPSAPAEGEGAPRRLMRAEAVLAARTGRFIVVLERSSDEHNQYAILRTAEAFGIQHVWFILHPAHAASFHINRKITKKKEEFLTLRTFDSTAECIAAVRAAGAELWATDLAPGAQALTAPVMARLAAAFPRRVALVLGAESVGISEEVRAAAAVRLYLPIHGFSDSLNVSVAAALVLQRLFDMCPSARGDLSDEERRTLRAQWYAHLASTPAQEALFASYVSRPPPPLTDLRREADEGSVWLPPKIAERDRPAP